jgi:hypothetical protein
MWYTRLKQKAASEIKRATLQEDQGLRMIRQRTNAATAENLQRGAIAAITVDKRDQARCSNQKLIGIVLEVSYPGLGCRMVTREGVLVEGVEKNPHWVPESKYQIANDNATLSNELHAIRQQVLNNEFNEDEYPKYTVKGAHRLAVGARVPHGRTACKCRRSNTRCGPKSKCGCIKEGVSCSSACLCHGRCHNPQNRSDNSDGELTIPVAG